MGELSNNQISRAVLCMRLYRVFNLKDEDYLTSVKLLYIYDWIEPYAGNVSMDVVTTLRKNFRQKSNLRTIDALYNELKQISMSHSNRYDTATWAAPEVRDVYYLGHKV